MARVLENLEHIAADARMEKQTGITLANAYVRLASLQGNPYEQNIGDTAGAINSLGKAMSILQPLAASNPKDTAVLIALARAEAARGEILSQADDNAGAAASMQASIATYERMLTIGKPTPELCFETAVAYETFGDLMGQDTGFADPAAALTYYLKAIRSDQRALELDPAYARVRRGLPLMQLKVGNVHLETDPAVALMDFRHGMDLLKQLPASDRSGLATIRLEGTLLRKQGLALSELGHYREARPLFAQSEQIYSSLIAADAKDLRAKRDMRLLLTVELQCEENAIDPVLAEAGDDRRGALGRAQEIAKHQLKVVAELLETQKNDADLNLELAATEVHLAALQTASRSAEASPASITESFALLRSAVKEPKTSSHNLELIFDAFEITDDRLFRDPVLMLACAQRGADLTHNKVTEWQLALAQAYRASGDVAHAKLAARAGLLQLPPPSSESKTFRMRRLLENAAAGN